MDILIWIYLGSFLILLAVLLSNFVDGPAAHYFATLPPGSKFWMMLCALGFMLCPVVNTVLAGLALKDVVGILVRRIRG